MVLKKKQSNKEVLTFTYPCYICGNILGKGRQVINHIEAIHGYKLPARSVGHKRPPDTLYEYKNDPSSREEYDLSHYACSSCWFHCPEAGLKELSDHINATHHPENVDSTKNKNGEIKGGEVTDIDRNAALAKARIEARKAEAETTDEEGEDEDEEMVETEDKQKNKAQPKRDMSDVYQKLNELADMFQKLFKGKEPF
ncbi:hypothetical protein INT46_008040 [Mucor plumbeus]|uniref:C2H2-type domain-containing protein n=1 Tax=Mucor plumbeus TaxID=97098 RepID=A0A8H7QWA1_9FUNG|nr:hypothetical protein INT46_008040 [Mucor plumbeus]